MTNTQATADQEATADAVSGRLLGATTAAGQDGYRSIARLADPFALIGTRSDDIPF